MMNDRNILEVNNILRNFNIQAQCVSHRVVGNYFYYDLRLGSQTKVKDIVKYGDELSLMLKTPCKPNVKVMHKEGLVRLEFVNPRIDRLRLFDYFTNTDIPKGDLMCLLGQAVDGERVWMDLSQNPHMIVSGTTGSGKSTLLHNIIANLYNYNCVNLFLIDPKNIEFTEYDKHMSGLTIGYSYYDTIFILDTLLDLMDARYMDMQLGISKEKFPYVVLIIDEFADLIMQDGNKEFYNKLCRLSQKCRAAKMHIVLSTQRPSVNIINGTIKANFPARISCRVASHIDSKVVLDSTGAENLMGNGDALVKDNYRNSERFQVAWTDAAEVCYYFGA